MPVTKIVPPGPIAMKREPLRPAAKTFAVKPAGRVSVRGSARRPLRNCGATSSITDTRAPSAAGVTGAAAGVTGIVVEVACTVAATVGRAEVAGGVAAVAAGDLVAVGLAGDAQATKV